MDAMTAGNAADLAGREDAIQARGRALLAAVEPEKLLTLTPEWWQERLMQWATADPQFRVKLLRFVDVLPTLRTARAVADHVRQYFRDDSRLPIRVGSNAAGTAAFRPVLSQVVRRGVFAMSDRFIGGSSPRRALPRLRELVADGTAYTIDLLGEATLSEPEADEYLARYLELVTVVAADAVARDGASEIRKPNVSLKLSALTSHFEPAAPRATSEAVARRLLPLLRSAVAKAVFVNIDMEQCRFKDLVQTIAEDVLGSAEFAAWGDAGIVVQAYLKSAPDDIARIKALAQRRGTPLTVRLVKGAYWDEETILAKQDNYESPVFEDKDATDASFERCTRLLIEAYPHLRPAFGTHNPRSIAQAIVAIEAAGLPRDQVEFQSLYGMAEGLRKAVKSAGYRTRVYVPAGEILPGMAYLVRRLLENTSNESWLLHRHEEGDPAELLQRPQPAAAPSPGATAGFENEVPAQFHLPAARAPMEAALATVRATFTASWPLSIAGADLTTANQVEVRYPGNPATVIGRVAQAGPVQVEVAVAAAREAFPGWRDTSVKERSRILRRAADLMSTRRFEFAATMVYESGKPWREADGDVIEAIDYLRYYAGQAERLAAGPLIPSLPGEDNQYLYEGRGVAAIIAPWNFPLAIITGMSTAALAAGCPVILKPAAQSPIVAARLVRLLHEAGVPASAAQYLPGPGEIVGPSLVEHPGVDLIAFTGSNAVGLDIVRRAAVVQPGQRNVKRVIAEMGGKNAIVVDEDADLDQAVAGVVASTFGYAGQKCSACSRVVVVGSAYEDFKKRLQAAVESLVVGPPDDAYTFVPPVISDAARDKIETYVAIGHTEGRLVAKGRQPEGPGWYISPHVFEGIGRDSRLFREEVFGPVLVLTDAPTFSAALEVALDSPFALTGGIFSRNPRHIEEARREFRVGNLYINRKITGAIVGRQPFGGSAMSGLGDKAGGPDYLLQFMVPRVITENTMRRGFAPDEPVRGGHE
jgi:RHH-type proline utilization regulon transcriptional repressor/proline dehydrogenase/delta 1-pyrroline-5-carboxylate dehydrogenase